MRKGIPVLLFIILFSANSYSEENMICYVPKKPFPKPTVPVEPVKEEVSVTSEIISTGSGLASQNTQVLIGYPPIVNEGKSGSDKDDVGFVFEVVKYILDFIVKILSILAWPAVLILIVRKFKEEIKNLAKRIAKANVGGMGFEFHDIADKYEDFDGAVTPEQEIKSDIDPRGTIISAWLNIETRLYQIYAAKNIITVEVGFNSPKTGPSIAKIIRVLKDKNIIGHDEFVLLRDLQTMRNKVVHEANLELTQDDVTKFLLVANYVEDCLKVIENQAL